MPGPTAETLPNRIELGLQLWWEADGDGTHPDRHPDMKDSDRGEIPCAPSSIEAKEGFE